MQTPTIRLDKWLWQARLCRTRSLAGRLIAEGCVRVNAVRVVKPGTPLRVGDGLTVVLRDVVRVLRVRDLGVRRGPYPEARGLYDDLDAPGAGPLERPFEPDT